MKPQPFNLETYAANCHRLILAGWMPCGKHGEMKFRKDGKTYDLNAANLDKLDHIEKTGQFVIPNDLVFRFEHKFLNVAIEITPNESSYSEDDAWKLLCQVVHETRVPFLNFDLK